MNNINSKITVKSLNNRQAGFSFVEMLISMAIFGVIMVGMNSMLAVSSKATRGQSNAANANMAARQSLLRISDLLAQAHYIYPAGQSIQLTLIDTSTENIQTGANAMAILLPEGTTYCPGSGQQYCGYIFSVENRGMFSSLLVNSKHASDFALVGWRAFNITWTQDDVPAIDLDAWSNVTRELLVDSIIIFDSIKGTGTDLGSFDRLDVSKTNTYYDNEKNFSNQPADKGQANSLIASVRPNIVIAYGGSSEDKVVARTSHIFARAIPRGSHPNPN